MRNTAAPTLVLSLILAFQLGAEEPSRNLARQATAQASSVHADYTPDKTTDGLLTNDSRWVSRDGPGPHTLSLTWTQPQRIGAVQVAAGWFSAGHWTQPVRDFKLQHRHGNAWQDTPGAVVAGNTRHALTLQLKEPVETDGLRLVANDAGYVRIVEVRVFPPSPAYPRLVLGPAGPVASAARPGFVPGSDLQLSGIYPHLAYYNDGGECGTGALVPWADRLWFLTYSPHSPKGSSDKLYEVDRELNRTTRPESVGGTPANRMIHVESRQLFIGPYAIDGRRNVRAIPYSEMFGRPTGNARHLFDPAGNIYCASMEEGFYEIDVKTLQVTEHFADEHIKETRRKADLPGYHGKGLYSGQGRLVYANNGERGGAAQKRPDIPSGVLAEWDGKSDKWTIVRRNQFVEVTGPGGIHGNPNPDTDPIWTTGWDHRSLLLGLRDNGKWQFFRLPKASHSYDGAHGWNTEWPRIRDIGPEGQPDLLMTMHGMFWRFPITFSSGDTAGIRPRSAYLKVIADFCRWDGRLVFACDDSAKAEFLNKRKAKGGISGPGQSNSNLWFTDPGMPDGLGSTTASGAVWLKDTVGAGDASDAFLFSGWERRVVFVANGGDRPVTFAFALDGKGNGRYEPLCTITVPAHGSAWRALEGADGEWIRVTAEQSCAEASVILNYSDAEKRQPIPDVIFSGLASVETSKAHGGLLWALGGNQRRLGIAALDVFDTSAEDAGYYELNGALKLRRLDKPSGMQTVKSKVPIPRDAVTVETCSVLVVDNRGRRWRLPKGNAAYDDLTGAGLLRVCREVSTERDLFSCHGTFYELPAENADGFAKIRPIASHAFRIMDYASFRGLLVMTGVTPEAGSDNPHIIRSEDGKAAVWAGAIDDLWRLGRPVGHGGPWRNTAVKAGGPSDPYLFGFYESRELSLSHSAAQEVKVRIDLDPTGHGPWILYDTVTAPAGQTCKHTFPAALHARWIRFTADRDATVTAELVYQ